MKNKFIMMDTPETQKGISKLFLIAFLLGGLGIHRFMIGKAGSAILFIFTAGGLGVWWIMDLIKIYKGEFK